MIRLQTQVLVFFMQKDKSLKEIKKAIYAVVIFNGSVNKRLISNAFLMLTTDIFDMNNRRVFQLERGTMSSGRMCSVPFTV